MTRLDQEKDPVVLHKVIELLQNHNRALTEQIKKLLKELSEAKGSSDFQQLRIAALERHLAKLTKQVFGPTSEQRSADAPADAEGTGEEPKDEKKKRPGHGRTSQPKLPVVEVEYGLDEADKVCPSCGGDLREMKGQYEESDEIEVFPLHFVLKRNKRKKYGCQCGGCIETALGPDKLTPHGRYSVDFAIDVAINKYSDHLPLERQVRRMAREGLVVTSQALWDQIELLTRVVESAMPRLHAHVLRHDVVGADETRWELLGKQPGQSKSWYVWVLRVEKAVFYAIKNGRSVQSAEALLASFTGVLMCDGYKVYESLSITYAKVVLAHCWAHVRREFIEIEKSFPKECGEVLDLIRDLYEIERACPDKGPGGDDLRLALRQDKSQGVIEKIEEWVWRTAPRCLPESGLHKAIGYMVRMWAGLVLFLDIPQIPLDNNGTENAARGPVLGRKNHYGSHSLRGTEVAATLYSLVESAKLNDLDPRLYLRVAVREGLRGHTVPLPHEVKAMLAEGKLDPDDYDNEVEKLVKAALAAAASVGGNGERAGPPPGVAERGAE